jgi:hypothetical protein
VVGSVAVAAAALSVSALAVLTGCSDSGSSPNPGPTGQAESAVEVTGTFRVGGGPAPDGIDEPLSGTVIFEGPVTERVDVGAGTFTVELLPGEYTVTGQPEGFFADVRCPSATATIVPGQAANVDVGCIVE